MSFCWNQLLRLLISVSYADTGKYLAEVNYMPNRVFLPNKARFAAQLDDARAEQMSRSRPSHCSVARYLADEVDLYLAVGLPVRVENVVMPNRRLPIRIGPVP